MSAKHSIDPWFTGFADGEGSFTIMSKNGISSPRFSLTLRADDTAILAELCRCFGGTICTRTRAGTTSNPQSQWYVGSKKDLRRLIAYFDDFPLRSKKARDYAIWREAVVAYCANGRTDPTLPNLFERLRTGRAYEEAA